MSLTLTIDGPRWREHLRAFAAGSPGLVPVAKGNGYGVTLGRLARRAQWLADQGLGADTLAVGTYEELPHVATRYAGTLLVLTPWRPFVPPPDVPSRRLVHTVSRAADLEELLDRDPSARYVMELMTSMRRHGMRPDELAVVVSAHPRGLPGLEGLSVHLPMTRRSQLPEARDLVAAARGAGLRFGSVWVSHLDPEELTALRAAYPAVEVRPRVGTALWLGEREALSVTARVLDVHRVGRGERFGYRGRPAPRPGHVVVVSGGTAHGIGLSAPTGDPSVRARVSAAARGALDAVGVARSPYLIDGVPRVFAEPPHMQASMLFLPSGSRVPDVGEEVEVRVRFTTTTFDRIIIRG